MSSLDGWTETNCAIRCEPHIPPQAGQPEARHAFPVGRGFAESLGYPSEWLDRIPSASLEAFAGVANVPSFVDVPVNGTVLDMGCGAGLDSLLIAGRIGVHGRMIGLDLVGPCSEERDARPSKAKQRTSFSARLTQSVCRSRTARSMRRS